MQFRKLISDFFSSGNNRTAKIKKNIAGSLGLKGIGIIVNLMMVPLTLGYLNSELYGIWLILTSIISWMQLMDVGFTNGLKNKLTEALASGDLERGKALVSTTYVIMAMIFVPLCLVLLLIAPYINWSWCLNVDAQYNDDICSTMYVLIVCFCTQMVLGVLNAVLSAYQRVAVSSSLVVIGNCISLGIVWLLTQYSEPSLQILSLAVSSMPIVVLLVASVYFYSKQLNAVTPDFKLYERRYVKDLFSLGAHFFLIQIQMVVLFQCTNILITNVSSAEDVTTYNIAYKYISTVMLAFTIMLQPLWPAFTDAFAKRDFGWMKSVYRKMTRIYMVCVVIVVLMVVISPWAFDVWVGTEAFVPLSMTMIVATYVLVHSWDSLQINIINGIGTIKLQTLVTMVGLIAHIPLSLFFSSFLGARGVVLSMICITGFYSVVFTKQLHKLINQKAEGIWAM